MANYKKACIHCGRLVDIDARNCPSCGSRSPLAWRCPTCMKEVQPQDKVCSSCGRSLLIECPHCRQQTRTNDRCDRCGKSLLIKCQNKRCSELQFFDLLHCNACGKKLIAGKFE
jgi:RNA polymerase subunit RPABC4/transcription elongation factor Spt4